jgi:hypothetical protein
VKRPPALGHGRREELFDFAKPDPRLSEHVRKTARPLAVSLPCGELGPELLGSVGVCADIARLLAPGPPMKAEVRTAATAVAEAKLGGDKALARERLQVVRG